MISASGNNVLVGVAQSRHVKSSGSNDIRVAFRLKLWRKCSQHPLLNSEMCNIESDHEHLMQSIGAHIKQTDLEFGLY